MIYLLAEEKDRKQVRKEKRNKERVKELCRFDLKLSI